MRTLLKIIVISIISLGILLSVYVMCLCYPELFFKYHVKYQNLSLYSDQSIPNEAMVILKVVQNRLLKSDIYNPKMDFRVFICNDLNRFRFYANYKYRVGGLNYELFNHNAFLRNANIVHNRLVGPSGNEVPGDRTLTYFITHEIVHGVTEAKTGLFVYYFKLPDWIKDGYADYIGKGSFDFKENIIKFKSESREMDPQKSGLYLKYHLFVAYLLDIKKIGTEELLENNYGMTKIAIELKQR